MHHQRDKKQKFKLLFSGTFIVLLTFSVLISEGCDQGYSLSTSETNVVVTDYDQGFDFAAQSTYSLPDEVQVIDSGDDDPDPLDPALNTVILDTTRTEMDLRGYSIESEPDIRTPDLEIKIFVTSSDIYGASGGYCWYYYYCYGYYPPYVYYKYTTGTVFTHMSDPDMPDNEGWRPPVWTAGLNGVISSTASNNVSRVRQMIQQSFAQSPYLNDN